MSDSSFGVGGGVWPRGDQAAGISYNPSSGPVQETTICQCSCDHHANALLRTTPPSGCPGGCRGCPSCSGTGGKLLLLRACWWQCAYSVAAQPWPSFLLYSFRPARFSPSMSSCTDGMRPSCSFEKTSSPLNDISKAPVAIKLPTRPFAAQQSGGGTCANTRIMQGDAFTGGRQIRMMIRELERNAGAPDGIRGDRGSMAADQSRAHLPKNKHPKSIHRFSRTYLLSNRQTEFVRVLAFARQHVERMDTDGRTHASTRAHTPARQRTRTRPPRHTHAHVHAHARTHAHTRTAPCANDTTQTHSSTSAGMGRPKICW